MAGTRAAGGVRRGGSAVRRGVVGTRGGVGRVAAMVVGLAVVLVLAAAGEARAGVYEVAQCGWGIGAELDQTLPTTEGSAFSLDPAGCLAPAGSGPVGLGFEGAVAPDGVRGLARARWVAPPGTSFTAAHVTWFGDPQPGNWQGFGVDFDGRFRMLAYSFGRVPPARLDLPIEGGAWAFEAWLQCLLEGPVVGCTRSVASTMHLRDLIFALDDPVAPTAQVGGALAEPGWHRGTATLALTAADAGSGVASVGATVDGRAVIGVATACAVKTIEGVVRATKLQPCPPTATQAVQLDTTRLADGAHLVHGCATDYSGAQGCAADAAIEVDNSPPSISFAAAAEGEVAAAVGDRYSGPASGTISIRRAETEAWIDLATDLDRGGDGTATLSAQLPDLTAGAYFLRAVGADAAGNVRSTQMRVVGSPAELRRQAAAPHGGKSSTPRGATPAPRGRATHLTAGLASGKTALTVDFGTAVEVRGRLTDRHGGGIARRPVAVTVRAAARISSGPDRHRVLTDAAGRFSLRLPPGTSRHITVAFHGGGGFGPARPHPLTLRVRAGVTLAAEPAELATGESVRLRGRVRLGPAHVPGRGKLIAIQYLERATKRWRPALVVRTDAEGRFATGYRFRYVTGVARIRLRATAPAEGGWPFARGSSAPVTVTVRSR